MANYVKQNPTEPGWYWQAWTKYCGPHLRRVFFRDGELVVGTYDNFKEPRYRKLSDYVNSYWSPCEPVPFTPPAEKQDAETTE